MSRRLVNLLTLLSLMLWLALLLGIRQWSDGGGTYWMGWPIDPLVALAASVALAVLPVVWLLDGVVTLPGKLRAETRALSGLCPSCCYAAPHAGAVPGVRQEGPRHVMAEPTTSPASFTPRVMPALYAPPKVPKSVRAPPSKS